MHYANEPFPEAQKPNTWTGKHLVLDMACAFQSCRPGFSFIRAGNVHSRNIDCFSAGGEV